MKLCFMLEGIGKIDSCCSQAAAWAPPSNKGQGDISPQELQIHHHLHYNLSSFCAALLQQSDSAFITSTSSKICWWLLAVHLFNMLSVCKPTIYEMDFSKLEETVSEGSSKSKLQISAAGQRNYDSCGQAFASPS